MSTQTEALAACLRGDNEVEKEMTMSNQTQTEALAALLAQMNPAQATAATGWQQAPAGAAGVQALIQSVSVPIKIETPGGSCRAYLQLPAEIGQSPQALLAALQQLQAAGYPLDLWQPRQQQGGGWNSGGGGWNGGNRGGGGYGGRRW